MGIFVITYIFKQWKIILIFKTIIKILIPFFIGLFIAWLFNPIVSLLSKKMKRGYATLIVYTLFLLVLFLAVFYCIPTMIIQLNDFVKVVPKLKAISVDVVNDVFDSISPMINVDSETIKKQIYDTIITFGTELTSDLPNKVISIGTSIISGFGTFLIGLVIGVYMLLDFNGISKHILSLFSKRAQDEIKELFTLANKTLLNFIQGTILISIILTIFTYIAFLLLGIKAPLLFALSCGITNIIPYIGPYIGGIPVALVGFSQSFTTGLLTIIVVVAAQALDGYILRPILLGRGLSLHPVTIIISLLIFGHFFGIIGMLLAMPIVSIIKIIFNYYDAKYDFFNRHEENNE